MPDGYKMAVSQAPAGGIRRALFPLHRRRPSWHWQYDMDAETGAIRLTLSEAARSPASTLAQPAPAADMPFVYVI